MVRQYLDLIKWDSSTGEPIFDNDGNPTNPPVIEISTSKSRYENYKGGKKEFTNKNGDSVFATGTIYVKYNEVLPNRFDVISLVKVRGINSVIKNFEVLSVDPNQLNSTIHVIEYVGNR